MSRRRVETQTRSHPESARAMAHHSAVRSFLDRHGFSDVDRPRDLDESVPHRIQMEPVYPIEVASALGKEAMVNMLLDAGAISNPRARQSPSLTSSSSSTSGSCCQSFASWPGTASTTRFAASPPTSPPASRHLRSCLAPKASEMASEARDRGKLPISTMWV